MGWLKNVKIGTKLMVGFILIAFIAGVVGIIGITKIKKIDNNYSDLYLNYGAAVSDIANVSISYQRLKLNLNKITMEKDTSNVKQYTNEIKDYQQQIDSNLNKFQRSIQTEEGRKQLENLKTFLDKYDRVTENVISLATSGKPEEGFKIMNSDEAQNLSDEINSSIDNLFDLKTSGGIAKSVDYSTETNSAVATMGGVIAIAVVIALIFGILISRSIDKCIKELMHITKEISNGNLNVEITNDSKDEIGMLSESMRKMKYKLHEVIGNISFAAEQVTVGSRQIADSTIALSQGATEQASAVEELTSSIEEISSQIKMNAENAKKANNIADNTKTNAIKGNSDMKLMLNSMDEINHSSNNIAKIIKVIDEIAFQTNILALNAAVEAARAGQYGKGFTVVAEEVRNLAARSANAAKETTEIIEESLIKIKDGTGIANQTAEALDSIVVDIQDVAKIIGDIAEASEEQATGISQISQGVVQISQVVQSNSATAEECAAASEELAGQSEVLKEQVEMFNLESRDKSNSYSKLNDNQFNISEKTSNRKEVSSIKNTYVGKSKANTKQIILSDTEFGKY